MSARAPLHHLDLNVSDLDRSHRFYDLVLTHLGYRPVDYSAAGEPEGFDWLAPDSAGRFSISTARSIPSELTSAILLACTTLRLQLRRAMTSTHCIAYCSR